MNNYIIAGGIKNVLLCDSVPKYVQIKHTKTRFYQGKTVSKLADIVRFNNELRSDLTKADFILLFV